MAGSDAGHALTALGLAQVLASAGDETVVYTGLRWVDAAQRRGLVVAELPGLAARDDDDDDDAGAKLSTRAARMAVALAPELALGNYDLVVSDAITLAGGWAAELCGLPWIELSSHPLYEQSRGLPPIGAGLAVGIGVRGRLRDRVLRALSAPALARGRAQRRAARAAIGLPGEPAPAARFVATLPGLEEPRPDWPEFTHLIGPQPFEPTDDEFDLPSGDGPLIVVCPSTAQSGNDDLTPAALAALCALAEPAPPPGVPAGSWVESAPPPVEPGRGASAGPCRNHPRVVYSALEPPTGIDHVPHGMVSGLGRQDLILAQADLVICGGGHGLLAKALSASVPVVVVPGGGDQWELACRVARAGAGIVVRPATAEAIASAVTTILGDRSYAEAAGRLARTRRQTTDPVRLAHRVIAEATCD